MAQDLIDLQEAKDQLRIVDDASDKRVYRTIDQAIAIVFDYIKKPVTTYEVGSPVKIVLPEHVKAAILLVIENLWDRPNEDILSPAVTSLLARTRDPAMA